MIVKFHNRGTGGGRGPVEYLLGRKGDREGATLLRGDPAQTIELIDSLKFAKKYTSLVLSFEETDLPPGAREEIMDSFERALLPGMEGRVDWLWVEHNDKGRVELNAVIPTVDLPSGKRIQPYYHGADLHRVDSWKIATNYSYGLTDPNDPAKRRALTPAHDLPKDRREIVEAIHQGVTPMVEQGVIHDRATLVLALASAGLRVARESKKSISIEDPSGGKNIRLTGAFYEREFAGLSQGLQSEIEARQREHRASAERRADEARAALDRAIEQRSSENRQRYPDPAPAHSAARDSELALGGRQPGGPGAAGLGEFELDGFAARLDDWRAERGRAEPSEGPRSGAVDQPGGQPNRDSITTGGQDPGGNLQPKPAVPGHREVERERDQQNIGGVVGRAVAGFRAAVQAVGAAVERAGEWIETFREGGSPEQGRERPLSRACDQIERAIEQREIALERQHSGPSLGV